ncbi:response regulator [Kineosporia babensis]|uniref:Response regulator n=1 Tax=Kineosporia babensis TaxID=499548 RepID=A0A9X1NLX8_9ACTN|nr:response regulator [Kineosporia babensis]MCD5315546.1 response regulator [Kineosporia babensis]
MARVLVVDDDPDTVRIVTFRLQSNGHRVIGTTSAKTALSAVAERGRPDVAILDISMPEMGGMELLVHLRAMEGSDNLPAIFLSARVMRDEVDEGRALGATYLTKPFIASALLRAIDEAIVPTFDSW